MALALSACAGQAAKSKPAVTELPAIPDPPFAWPSAPPAPDPEGAVRAAVLSFAWPEKLRARETVSATSTVLGGAQPKTTTKSYSVVMSADQVADGYRIAYSDMQYDMPGATEHIRAAVNASLQPLMSVLFPSFVISPKGRFLRLENPQQVVADAKSLAESSKLTKDTGQLGIRITSTAGENISADSIAGELALGWDMMVGYWSGGSLATGKLLQFRLPAADQPQTVVVYDGTSRLVGHIACGDGEAPDGCVALEMTLKADPAGYTSWLQAHPPVVAETAGTKTPLFNVTGGESEVIVRLVAEPTTLRPRRFQWIQRGSLAFELSASKVPLTWRSQTVTIATFDYLAL